MIKQLPILALLISAVLLGFAACEEPREEYVRYGITEKYDPTVHEQSVEYNRAHQFAGRLGVALNAYRVRVGYYPNNLKELTADDIDQGRTEPAGDDYVIYKVGNEGQSFGLHYIAVNNLGQVISYHFTSESLPGYH